MPAVSAPAPAPANRYRPDIDGLRALAVLAVLVFHAFPGALPGGFVGVDVFFVISGFLIHRILIGNLSRGSLGLGEFYVHRVKRILPALLLVLMATLVAGWFWLLGTEYKELGKHAAASTAFIVNLVLLGESGYFDAASETKPLLHLWSLAVEEQFYLVWPLLLAAAWKWRLRPIGLVAVVGALSFAANLWLTWTHPAAAYYFPGARLWELLAGAMLASFARSDWPQRQRSVASVAGLAMIVITLFTLHREDAFPGWWALLPVLGTTLLIGAGPTAWMNRRLLSNPAAVWVGKISYPLYLWHWPLLTFARAIGAELPTPLVRAGLLLASVALAWLTLVLVERPIRFGAPARWKFVAPLALLVLVGLIGHNIDARNGLEFRLANRGLPNMKSVADGWYRHKDCMIDAADARTGPASFAAACDGRSAAAGRPLLLLWGDSHAASLYPGLLAWSKRQGFDLAQFTATGCAPLTGDTVLVKPPQCAATVAFGLQKIAALKPAVVLVSAYWSAYKTDGRVPGGIYPDLRRTIDAVKAAGVGRVVLVGHLPTFLDGQPGIGARVFVPGTTDRTYKGFDPRSREHDALARAAAAEAGVAFVSPIDLLCDGAGCLISTSTATLKPLAWDYGHLTEWGSQFLVDKAIAERPAAMRVP